jgi:hypothetical protein
VTDTPCPVGSFFVDIQKLKYFTHAGLFLVVVMEVLRHTHLYPYIDRGGVSILETLVY